MPQLLTSLHDFPESLKRGAVSVGNFDGVHRGHARLIEQLVAVARRQAGPALVMTFDPPPTALLFPQRRLSAPLTSIARRAELLFALGVDALIAYPTDKHLLELSAEEFFRETICGLLQARAMVEGPNFRFGRQRGGDVQRLSELCAAAEVEFQVVPASTDPAGMISSTRIRTALAAGDIRTANAMLTEPYRLQGVVVPGARRGSDLGFATANLAQIETLLPSPGVYAGCIELADNGSKKLYAVAMNIGPNLTFDETQTKVEAHIIGYAGGPLYGQTLQVALLSKIRDIRKFSSLDDLRMQIAVDVTACASCFRELHP